MSRFGLFWMATGLVCLSLAGSERVFAASMPCGYCHNLHNAQRPKLINTTESNDNLCISCHNGSGPGQLVDLHVTTSNNYDCFRWTCNDCHSYGHSHTNSRGVKNIMHMRDTIRIPHSCGVQCLEHQLVYECRGTNAPDRTCGTDISGALADGTSDFTEGGFRQYRNPCEVCHARISGTKEGYHENSHKAGLWCQACHAHSAGFDKAGGPGTVRNTYYEDNCDSASGGPCGPTDHGYCEPPTEPLTCADGDTGSNCAWNWEECTPSGTEDNATVCADSNDNDCDGDIDCADSDCAAFCVCTDNDNDTYAQEGGPCGPVDCNDGDDQINPGIVEDGATYCLDTKDNDCNSVTDCDEPACASECGLLSENTFADCHDDADNDSDGLFDCADPDCWSPTDHCTGENDECCRSGKNEYACYLSQCTPGPCDRSGPCDVY